MNRKEGFTLTAIGIGGVVAVTLVIIGLLLIGGIGSGLLESYLPPEIWAQVEAAVTNTGAVFTSAGLTILFGLIAGLYVLFNEPDSSASGRRR